MRFSMAFLAGRHLPMAWMAFCTGKRTMLCLTSLQQVEGLVMTSGTDFFSLGNWVGYSQRRMHWMAGQAIRSFKYCHGAMVLMAFSTLWDASVFF